MNIQPNSKGLGLITLMVMFCITSPVFAQNGSTDEEVVQRYEELLEYRTNYTIEQNDDVNQLSDTFTGVDLETNENVYVGDLTLATKPDDLPKVTLEDPTEEETLAYGSYEYVEYQDMFDFESDGNGNAGGGGFGVSVTGGKGDCPHGWNW